MCTFVAADLVQRDFNSGREQLKSLVQQENPKDEIDHEKYTIWFIWFCIIEENWS